MKWEIVCTQTRDVTNFCAVSDSLVRKYELCLVTTWSQFLIEKFCTAKVDWNDEIQRSHWLKNVARVCCDRTVNCGPICKSEVHTFINGHHSLQLKWWCFKKMHPFGWKIKLKWKNNHSITIWDVYKLCFTQNLLKIISIYIFRKFSQGSFLCDTYHNNKLLNVRVTCPFSRIFGNIYCRKSNTS